MTWTGTNNAYSNFFADGLANPVRINGGTVILKSSDLLAGGANIVHNGVRLKYDCSLAPGIITTPATNRGNISGSGAFQMNAGVLTLAGTSSYAGATTVSGGKLVFQGAKTGAGDMTVADGATLGVFDTGAQVTPGTLTIGANIGANLEFYNVHSTTTPIIAAGTLSSAGTNGIIVNGSAFVAGQSYPLLTWTSGPAPVVSLAAAGGFAGTLSISGNTLFLNVSAIVPSLNFVRTGNSLQLSWNTNFGTFKLQSQTNSSSMGMNTNWAVYPGGDTTPVTVPIDTMNETVFFRLISP
jgi:autotransporter-associated beta strand protein